ncbi:MAG TPA: aminopeptidase [Gaiellaceae bacterium]|nr:aminopeptidase [Gaiellaceae bacterium]
MQRFEEWSDKLADLAVFGASVQPGKVVAVTSYVGKEDLTRRVAEAAYRRGAVYVDVLYFDQWVKRARVAHAPEDTLDFVPPWLSQRLRWLSEERAARITLSGPHAPRALEGVDPARAGRDLLPYLPESGEVVNARTTSWTIAPAPTPAWAEAVYPDLSPAEAYERLWEAVAHVCRLEADDPQAAWLARVEQLKDNARRLNERRFDALRLHGPGTDLTIGLFPSSRWQAGDMTTVEGVRHFPNLPTEETFTTPDPARAEGHVSATMPLELYGSVVSGLRVEFRDGRAVKIDADEGADALRAAVAKDEDGSRLGEIALVDGEGRIGPLGTVFLDTLIDENAATHIALGNGYAHALEDEADRRRMNTSQVHVDFMIGSPELAVDGIAGDGTAVPVLRGGAWQI